MAKKKESLERRLKKAARKGKKPTEPAVKAPSKVTEERAAIGGVKLRRPSRTTQEPIVRTETPFGPLNWLLLAGGVAVAIVGFIFLYFGDTVISTTLLVLGYCVVIPVALLINPKILKKKPKEKDKGQPKVEAASKPEPQPKPETQPEAPPEVDVRPEPEIPEGGKKEGETEG